MKVRLSKGEKIDSLIFHLIYVQEIKISIIQNLSFIVD